MAKWNIYGAVCGTKYIGEVEAETAEEAEEKGWRLPECGVSVCHHCDGEISDPQIERLVVEQDLS